MSENIINHEQRINVKLGQTVVRVMRKNINELTGKEQTVKVNEGVIVQDNGSFVRVYNNAPREKGGDLSPETSEMVPVFSPACGVSM